MLEIHKHALEKAALRVVDQTACMKWGGHDSEMSTCVDPSGMCDSLEIKYGNRWTMRWGGGTGGRFWEARTPDGIGEYAWTVQV